MAFTKCPKCEQPVWEGMACTRCGGERVGEGIELDPEPVRSAAGETFAAIARVTVILVLAAGLAYAVFFWRETSAEADAPPHPSELPNDHDTAFCGAMNMSFTAASAEVPDGAYEGCALVTRGEALPDDWRKMRRACEDTGGAFLVKCVKAHY